VFPKGTISGGPKVDLLLIALLQLCFEFLDGIDKCWIVSVRKSFYFHHCLLGKDILSIPHFRSVHKISAAIKRALLVKKQLRGDAY